MLGELISKVRSVSEGLSNGSLIQDSFLAKEQPLSDRICDFQRDQLMGGLRSDGEQITPSISRDPFFKSIKSARRYADRKMRTAYDPRRGYDTPNLTITGYFHSGFYTEFRNDGIFVNNGNRLITSHGRFTTDLYEKYGADTFGLTDQNWDAMKEDMRNAILVQLRNTLQLL